MANGQKQKDILASIRNRSTFQQAAQQANLQANDPGVNDQAGDSILTLAHGSEPISDAEIETFLNSPCCSQQKQKCCDFVLNEVARQVGVGHEEVEEAIKQEFNWRS